MTILTVNMTPLGVVAIPVLTGASAAASGPMAWSGSVTTDVGQGTLHYLVSLNATETEASLLAAPSITVTQTGTQFLGGSGLSENTSGYRLHLLHVNTSENSGVVSTASFGTPAQGVGAGSVSIAVGARSNLQVAPEPVAFEASVSVSGITDGNPMSGYDQAFHECVYLWDFGDPGAVSDKVINLAVGHNDLNAGYGKLVGHVYTNPGTYTVTCTAYLEDGTFVGADSTTVTVQDPDAVFSGNRTILFDPNGVGDSATYPGSQVFTTLSAAIDAMYNLTQTGRVLIKRGITTTQGSVINIKAGWENFYIGTYGAGARPKITYTGPWAIFDIETGNDVVMSGFELDGRWDPQTETGDKQFAIYPKFRTAGMLLVDDCDFHNFGEGMYTPENAGCLTAMHNSRVGKTANYSVYSDGSGDNWNFYIGCEFAHDPQSRSGGSGSWSVGNAQGNFRNRRGGRWIFSCCDMFSRQGWTPAWPTNPWEQATLRFNTDVAPNACLIMERCASEGGISCNRAGGGDPNAATCNALVEKCLLVGNPATGGYFEWDCPGLTFRNNIGVKPDQPQHANGWEAAIQLAGTPKVSAGDPVRIYNNTFVNNLSAGNQNNNNIVALLADDGAFGNVTEINNVVAAPNQTAREPQAPVLTMVDMATVGGAWSARYLGPKQGSNFDSSKATPPGTVKDYHPDTGSPLIGTASGVTPYDDFYGAVRSGADRGAVKA